MAHKTFRTIVKSRRRIVLPKGFEEGDEVRITVELIDEVEVDSVKLVKKSTGNLQRTKRFQPCRICGNTLDTHSTKCSYINEKGKRLFAHKFCL